MEILIEKDTADKDINIQIENAVSEVEEGEIVAEEKKIKSNKIQIPEVQKDIEKAKDKISKADKDDGKAYAKGLDAVPEVDLQEISDAKKKKDDDRSKIQIVADK